jgi:peptidoglycan/xylan/chitin deacetylase (PgdA/CDA1 family)
MPQTLHNHKPLASISLDLDNQWSYMKTHGNPGWEKFPSYLDIFIPYVLDFMDRLSLKITFFVVGQDASLDKNKDALKLLTAGGHEVANHTFSHEPWLHLYSKDHIKGEILKAHEQIYSATSQAPIGFRGPGFTWSLSLLEAIATVGYVYDASTLPTYIDPLARMYFFRTSNLTRTERKQRKKIYGTLRDGVRPVKPYFWGLPNGRKLLEIPVTTIPLIKTPFHLSYLLYLSGFSIILMLFYLKLALCLCRLTKTEPSFLLHPLDFIGGNEVPELAFFPGMDVNGDRKIKICEKVLRELAKHFTLVNMSAHAESILKSGEVKTHPCYQPTSGSHS